MPSSYLPRPTRGLCSRRTSDRTLWGRFMGQHRPLVPSSQSRADSYLITQIGTPISTDSFGWNSSSSPKCELTCDPLWGQVSPGVRRSSYLGLACIFPKSLRHQGRGCASLCSVWLFIVTPIRPWWCCGKLSGGKERKCRAEALESAKKKIILSSVGGIQGPATVAMDSTPGRRWDQEAPDKATRWLLEWLSLSVLSGTPFIGGKVLLPWGLQAPTPYLLDRKMGQDSGQGHCKDVQLHLCSSRTGVSGYAVTCPQGTSSKEC